MTNVIKNSTYVYSVGTADAITFIPLTAADARLTFRVASTKATEKGSAGSVRIQRNELSLNLPFKAAGSDCDGACGTISVAKAAKLTISAPTVLDAQDVIDELIRVLQHEDAVKFIAGFKPLPTSTFTPLP